MSELGTLLELIHDAHTNIKALEAEYRDWSRPRPSLELRIERSVGDAQARLRGAGPFPRAASSIRRIWLNPPKRLRVEVTSGHQLVSLGVLDSERWWCWDPDSGPVSSDLTRDQPESGRPPPLLTPPLIDPAVLLTALRFEVVGYAARADRKVIRARARPRRSEMLPRALYYELEFDAQHGTILRRAAHDEGHLVSVTEATAIAYDLPIEPARFIFTSPDGQPVRHVERRTTGEPGGPPQNEQVAAAQPVASMAKVLGADDATR
jgi:hypothetical protein